MTTLLTVLSMQSSRHAKHCVKLLPRMQNYDLLRTLDIRLPFSPKPLDLTWYTNYRKSQ